MALPAPRNTVPVCADINGYTYPATHPLTLRFARLPPIFAPFCFCRPHSACLELNRPIDRLSFKKETNLAVTQQQCFHSTFSSRVFIGYAVLLHMDMKFHEHSSRMIVKEARIMFFSNLISTSKGRGKVPRTQYYHDCAVRTATNTFQTWWVLDDMPHCD